MAVTRKILKIVAAVLMCLVIARLLFNLFLNIEFSEFYSSAKGVGEVAGLNDGGVQQGLDYVEESKALLSSCYMTDDSASRIYVTKDGKTTYTELYNKDGTAYDGHVGGICHNGAYLYVGASGGIKVFSLADVLDGKDKTTMIGEVKLINTASWCTVNGGYLYAGKFSSIEDAAYQPAEEYMIKNPKNENEMNCSIISVYKLSAEAEFGIESENPELVMSCIGTVQGGVFTKDGNLILSTSRGIAPSRFYFYDMEKARTNTLTYTEDGKTYPMIFLGLDSLTYKLEGPPMAEEIVVIDGAMYIMNESACIKYLFGNLIGGRELYALPLKDSYFGK